MMSEVMHATETAFRTFVGRITANFTHEMKNRLAVIKETSGLQQDLISYENKRVFNAKEVMSFLETIDRQILESLIILSHMNRYAHRMDAEYSTFSANNVVEELVTLISRIAYRRNVSLLTELDPAVPPVYSNPTILHMLLFSLFDNLLCRFDSEGSITFKTNIDASGITIALIPKGTLSSLPDLTDGAVFPVLGALTKDLAASISQDKGNGALMIILPAGTTSDS